MDMIKIEIDVLERTIPWRRVYSKQSAKAKYELCDHLRALKCTTIRQPSKHEKAVARGLGQALIVLARRALRQNALNVHIQRQINH